MLQSATEFGTAVRGARRDAEDSHAVHFFSNVIARGIARESPPYCRKACP